MATALAGCSVGPVGSVGVIGTRPIPLDSVALVEVAGRQGFCSGSLVSERLVLTALHCVQAPGAAVPEPVSAVRVGFGADVREARAGRVRVRAVRVRPGARWDSAAELRGNDLAVLVLEAPVARKPFSPAGFESPLEVPPEVPIEVGTELFVAGFGEDRDSVVGRRHATRVRVTQSDERGFTFVGGGCSGDSGGPVLDREGRLHGLVSLAASAHCEPARTRFGQPLAPFRDLILRRVARSGRALARPRLTPPSAPPPGPPGRPGRPAGSWP